MDSTGGAGMVPFGDLVKPPRRRASLGRKIRKDGAFRSLLLALLALRLVAGGRRRLEVECHPGVPHHKHVLWKVALLAGIRLLPCREGAPGDAARPRLRLFWPDPAAADASEGAPPEWLHGALNGGARDASKREVERVFAEVFGYALAVDPTTHEGTCVAKSDRRNGAHDGRVVECPIAAADPALAYERLVDNRADGGTVLDLRVPVVGGELPFVYLKRRPLRARFSNANSAVEVAGAGEVFSEGEVAKLLAFCRAMRLDLAELDVLRDAGDGRVYVVDVNRTSWGPPKPLRTAEAVRAVRAYAAAFARLAERTVAGSRDAWKAPMSDRVPTGRFPSR